MAFTFRELIADGSDVVDCGGDSYCGGTLALQRLDFCGGDSYCGGTLSMVRDSSDPSLENVDELLAGLNALAR